VSWGAAEGGGVVDGITGAIDLFPYDFAREMEANKEMFAATASYGSFPFAVSSRTPNATQTVRAMAQLVSSGFFDVLGVNPSLGRMFDSSDATAPGKNPVTVLSFDYWQSHFAGARAVLGKAVIVNGSPFEIVGVAPEHFFGISLDVDPDMWIPLTMQPQVTLRDSWLAPRGLMWLHMISRMPAGVSLAKAREWTTLELRRNLIARKGGSISPDEMKDITLSRVELQPGGRGVTGLRRQYWEPLQILMGVTGVVLLIACANLASFSLARMASREKEIFARLALGAGRARIVRQMLTEGLVLSVLGGLLGLALASWAAQALIHFVISRGDRTPLDSTPDAAVLGFTFAASILTGILFSVVPAFRASQVDLASRLRVSTRSVVSDSSRPGRIPLSRILVSAQVALSLVLLAGAGLFIQTLHNLDRQGFGFNRQNALLVEFDAKVAGYRTDNQIRGYDRRLLERLAALPEVRAVSMSAAQPVSDFSWRSIVFTGLGPGVLSRPLRPGENISSFINSATPRYFEVCGIELLAGRSFEERDRNQAGKVAVVSQAFAKHFFPSGDTLGQLVSVAGTAGQWQIVGVVSDGRYTGAREAPPPMIYLPLFELEGDDAFAGSLQLRTAGDPQQTIAQVRKAFAEVDPNVALSRIEMFTEVTDRFLSRERLISRLSTFFSIGAILLAAIGLYGVMSHSVARRSGEIGVRMALGAEGSAIRSMILRESTIMLAAGIAIGVPVTLGVTRAIRSQLFGVSPFDTATLTAAAFMIGLVTLLAGWLPASHASKVDPIIALRDE
jgi:predicted permease